MFYYFCIQMSSNFILTFSAAAIPNFSYANKTPRLFPPGFEKPCDHLYKKIHRLFHGFICRVKQDEK